MAEVKRIFTSVGVNARSSCLCSSRQSNHVVFATDGLVCAETVPQSTSEFGHICCVSERRHPAVINCLKRLKSDCNDEFFVSGDSQGTVVLWQHIHGKISYITALDQCKGSSISSLCGIFNAGMFLLSASWGGSTAGNRIWQFARSSVEDITTYETESISPEYVLTQDILAMTTGLILVFGTSKRNLQIYTQGNDSKFVKVLSFVAHDDWIHSIAFNERSSSTLLASAGQDTYVKIWKIEPIPEVFDAEELCVKKNDFSIRNSDGKEVTLRIGVESVLAAHEEWVHSTEWDLSGSKLVTSSSDKTAIVWEESNELWVDSVRLGIVGGQSAGFYGAVFSPDGKQLVANSYFGGLFGWITTGEDDRVWEAVTMSGGHVGEARDVCWQRDGLYLMSVGKDQTTRVFAPVMNTKTFAEIARPQVHGHDMQCLTSISKSVFVSGAEEKIFRAFTAPVSFANSYCNISGASKETFKDAVLEEYGARVPALGLSNKAIGQDDVIAEVDVHWEEAAFQANPSDLFAPPTEDCLQQSTLWPEAHKLYGHGFEVYAVACSPCGGVLATACKASHVEHAVILFWDTSDWSQRSQVHGHQLTVTAIEWSHDGQYIISSSRDRTVALYQRQGDAFSYAKVWQSTKEHSRIIWSCTWFDDSTHFVTVARDQKVIVWKREDNKASAVASIKCRQPVVSVAVADGSLSAPIVIGLQDGSLQELSFKDNSLQLVDEWDKTPLTTLDSPALRLRFCPNSTRLAAAFKDGRVVIYQL